MLPLYRHLTLGVALAILLMSLASCGYKDNLYIPGEPEQEQPDSGKERRATRR